MPHANGSLRSPHFAHSRISLIRRPAAYAAAAEAGKARAGKSEERKFLCRQRIGRTELQMTTQSSKRSKPNLSSHRTYVKNPAGHVVRCSMVSTEELAHMAETANDLVLYQAGPNLLPPSEISRIVSPLRALAWPHRDLLTDPQQLRRIVFRQIGDRLARLRLKTGRHILAGLNSAEFGIDRKTLVLVLVSHRVETCDWEILS
jgi:hypothetical protein